MANLKKLKQRAIEQRPTPNDITSYESLKTNFAYSLLINTSYKEQIEGFSPVEMGNWIKAKGLQSDYDLLELVVEDNYTKEVSNGQ